MTPRQLRYFLEVAQAGSITAAAHALHIAQPALSQQIQKLEDELGTQIFERRTNDVTMTPAGERIVSQAQRVLDEAGEKLKQVVGDVGILDRLAAGRVLEAPGTGGRVAREIGNPLADDGCRHVALRACVSS